MEVLQLVLEVFVKTPAFLVVPLLLLVFVFRSPWSPSKFYVHHDHEHLGEQRHAQGTTVAETGEPELRVY